MQSSLLVIFLLLVHAIICVACMLCIHMRILKVHLQIMPVVFFVPIWGAISAVLLHFLSGLERPKENQYYKLHTDEQMRYSILTDNVEEQKSIVPLEEALLMNEPQMRRSMMLDILSENPDEYFDLLEEARINDDHEIVHYATTAMAELAKEYDIGLQTLEREYAAHPEDEQVLREYCSYLDDYLKHDLVEGQMIQVLRTQYVQLLSKLIRLEPDPQSFALLIQTLIKLGEFGQVDAFLEEMMTLWPDHEETLLAQLEYAVLQGETDKVHSLVARVHKEGVYLSAYGREKIGFFTQENRAMEEGNIAI